MTGAAGVYGQGLYALAKEESLEEAVLQELSVLKAAFAEEPEFLKLLSSRGQFFFAVLPPSTILSIHLKTNWWGQLI